jgi:hypothetical protein
MDRSSGCSDWRVNVTNAVDEIATENDDCYRAGNHPVRAMGRYEPFVGSFLRVAWCNWLRNWGTFHVRPLRLGVMRENASCLEPFPSGQYKLLTSLMIDEFLVCKSDRSKVEPPIPFLFCCACSYILATTRGSAN